MRILRDRERERNGDRSVADTNTEAYERVTKTEPIKQCPFVRRSMERKINQLCSFFPIKIFEILEKKFQDFFDIG